MPSLKKVLIMRHAKSSWSDSSQKDFDRPLNSRGERDAPEMGNYLNGLGIRPGYVISSPARRAKQTVLLLTKSLGYDQSQINWNEDLYYSGAEAYLEALRNVPEQVNTALIAGHNPSVEEVISNLSGRRDLAITTANIACFETNIDSWSDLKKETCDFKWLVTPKTI